MAFTYTRSQLKSDINSALRGKIGMISNVNDFLNRVVRETKNDVKIRSAKRKQQLTPDLVNGPYRYACAADLDNFNIIDIPAQAKRYDDSFGLVPIEQFNVNPQPGDIAIDDYNGTRVLCINSQVDDKGFVVDSMSAASDWTAFGDAENITNDGDDYITGNNSISFDISSAGGTTAGIYKDDIPAFSIVDYLDGTSALHVWTRINSATDITNYIMRLGTDASNYYSKTVTAAFDGTAFASGWNLLRFPLTSLTETGTVTQASIQYLALYMTKDAGKISETDYKFNYATIKRGVIHNVLYYSKYGWQSSAGVYKQASTDDSDLLVADDTEYDIFIKKGVELGLPFVNGSPDEITFAATMFNNAALQYGLNNPDESQIMVSTYHQH